jgi:hypothetical protein
MNFTEINHCLTTAINNLAEGEIDVAALAMAEDLEREELEEAKRTKKEQQRIDGLALKKYGMKWRTTPSGSVLGLTRKGKVVAGNPNLLKTLPKEKLSRKAKETMGALKDAPSESGKKGAKTKAINKMLSAKNAKKKAKNKHRATMLRDKLAKAKKKMGMSFNAMLMQSMEDFGNISEALPGKKAMASALWKSIAEKKRTQKLGNWTASPHDEGILLTHNRDAKQQYIVKSPKELMKHLHRFEQNW